MRIHDLLKLKDLGVKIKNDWHILLLSVKFLNDLLRVKQYTVFEMPFCTLFSKNPFVNCFRNAPLYTVFKTPLCSLFSKRSFVNCFRNAPFVHCFRNATLYTVSETPPLYTVFETPLCTLFSKRPFVNCFRNVPLYTVFKTPLCTLFSKRSFVHCSQLQGRWLLVRNQLHKNILNYAQFRLRQLPSIFYGTSLQKYLTAIIVKHFYQKTPSQVFYTVLNPPLTKMVIIKEFKFRNRICWESQHSIFSHWKKVLLSQCIKPS